ncbi:transcriptional regulatory family protein [[Clostridium] bifermentans ATCC 638]|uniref:Stage 0 sporulation protein A homolog n=1 Tax=Paraclostridium bifermentans ATCC 638 = DSM 14991 TaxID=1233171 RepID=T4VRA4_PARBF|nr:response regulator transcription factor [Paraclostridium bifermentans]EQK43212.1 transcriptional regulatory family protein [[Clostridium] bifermentans ATCC 638] [Paraclostridium bifermentans ATCC 638 = DSM 14991]RIZ60436.1 DNA-binding response regulator [Paraclostridium bifermentans]UAG17078.1 response regulator transcription factor [Paraclostridium bifermentans]
MEKILLVEDDEALAMGTEYSLLAEGFEVKVVGSVEDAKSEIENNDYDLAILDINLPDGTGYEACKFIRKTKDMSIIFLTALDEEVNIVLGLDIGADDYITKPFRIRELISRIKAVLRRSNKYNFGKRYLKSGDIIVDTFSIDIKKNRQEILLTTQEYKLLLSFMKKPNQFLSRDDLLESVFKKDYYYVDDNTISVYIKRLRDKIEDNSKEPKYIVNKRGMGYKWNMEVEEVM